MIWSPRVSPARCLLTGSSSRSLPSSAKSSTAAATNCFETEPIAEDSFVLGVSTTLVDREGGDRPAVTAIFQDITEKKRVEALRMRSEKLEAVAELSASLAHEIKNPLASIRSAVEQITGGEVDPEDARVLRTLVVRRAGQGRKVALLSSDPLIARAVEANGCTVLVDPEGPQALHDFAPDAVVAFDGFAGPSAFASAKRGANCAMKRSASSTSAGSRPSGELALNIAPRRNSSCGVESPGVLAYTTVFALAIWRASAKAYRLLKTPQLAGSIGP